MFARLAATSFWTTGRWAMIVTSSRAAAVRYKKGFDAYIEKHPQHRAFKGQAGARAGFEKCRRQYLVFQRMAGRKPA